MEPQHGAPNQIKGRLPPASREGLPSLPFLLDSTKLLADLVELWATRAPSNISETGVDQAVKHFDRICRSLHQRSQECMSLAELAEKPDAKMESKWQKALHEQQRNSHNVFEQSMMPSNTDPDLTALPQPADAPYPEQIAEVDPDGDTAPSSAASAAAWDRRGGLPKSGDLNRALTSSTNSSTASLEVVEENRARPPPGSRDGKKNNRLFSGRRKGRGDRGHAHDEANDN